MSPWVKLDDSFHSNPKINDAWKGDKPAIGLYAMALSYCGQHLTDGFVHDSFVEQKIPQNRERKKTTETLVNAGLWDRTRGGFLVNDFFNFNPSRQQVNEKRERERLKKAKQRELSPGDSPETRAHASRPDPTRDKDNNSKQPHLHVAVPSRESESA